MSNAASGVSDSDTSLSNSIMAAESSEIRGTEVSRYVFRFRTASGRATDGCKGGEGGGKFGGSGECAKSGMGVSFGVAGICGRGLRDIMRALK